MAKIHADGARTLASLGFGVATSASTGNPLPAIAAFIDSLSWVYGALQQEDNQKPASQKPAQTVSEIIDSIMDGWEPRAPLSPARPGSWAASGQPAWIARLSESDRKAVQARVRVIARSPQAGSDFDWMRALFEVQIAERAGQIARSPLAGSGRDNWLQAERELLIAQRARQIADSPAAAGQLDNMLRAEREVLTELRAAQIARSPLAGSSRDNWLLAEREVLIAQRARQIAASPRAGHDLDNWLKAERDLEARGIIKPRPGRTHFGVARPLTVTAILRIDLPNRTIPLSPKVVSGVAIVAAAGAVVAVLRRRRRKAAKVHDPAPVPVDGSPATDDMDAEADNAAAIEDAIRRLESSGKGPNIREAVDGLLSLGYRLRRPKTSPGKRPENYLRIMDPAYTAHGVGYLTPTAFSFSRMSDRQRLMDLPGAQPISNAVNFSHVRSAKVGLDAAKLLKR